MISVPPTSLASAKPYSLSVKAIILDAEGRCLLVRRSVNTHHFAGCWEWPGGKVDPGEDFASAVLRECREEIGLEVELTGLAGATEFEMPAVRVVLVCMEARAFGSAVRLSEEHDESAWVPVAELRRWKMANEIRSFVLDYARRKMEAS